MAIAEPAAAAAPSLLYMGLALLSLCAFGAVIGTRAVWVATFGWLLTELGDALTFSILGHHFGWGDVFHRVNNTVLNAFHDIAAGLESSVGYFFHGAAYLFQW